MNIIEKIVAGVWMMDPMTANAYLPIFAKIIGGDMQGMSEEVIRPYAYSTIRGARYTDFGTAPSTSIAVYPITGLIMKEDSSLNGWFGMKTLMDTVQKADKAENIIGHFFEFDCGGGEASIIETVAQTVRAVLTKPVVCWFNDKCCSAAYYIAAGGDEVYASESTDIAGSIGIMASFNDFRGFWEQMGIKTHEIYSKFSDKKNQTMIAAREGDYEPYQEKILDPYAQQFIATMKQFRPGMTAPEAFAGEIYMAEEAKAIGMIDGILTREAALERVIQLHNNNLEMKKIGTVLGYQLEMKDGGCFLRADELAKLENNLVTGTDEVVEKTALQGLQDGLGKITGSLESIATRLTALETTTTAQATELETLKAAPGATKTEIAATGDLKDGDLKTALADFNAAMEAASANGGRLMVTK